MLIANLYKGSVTGIVFHRYQSVLDLKQSILVYIYNLNLGNGSKDFHEI